MVFLYIVELNMLLEQFKKNITLPKRKRKVKEK